MRVVAGTAGGRALQAPAGDTTRPTSDRVREAVFSILMSLGVLDEAVVVDLFAGTGALGIEALSRGAARATFVDRDPAAVAAIRANLTVLGPGVTAEVVRGDALGWVGPAAAADLVFVDPPYSWDRWPELLSALLARDFAGLLVVETGRGVEVGEEWAVLRVRRYGGTVVQVMQARRAPAAASDDTKGSV